MKKNVTTYSFFILLLLLSINKIFASTSTDNKSVGLWSNDTSHVTADNFLNNSERFKTECNEQKIARACFAYATYLHVEPKLYKQAYDYFVIAFDLGQKESGAYIANYQINDPEIFNDNERLSIDESIYYAKQAFKADFPDATKLLMMTYRNPELNRIDLEKSEYYNKIAIEQNVKMSRFLLASLYINEMKDKSKIHESIKLLNEDLILEKNWGSSLILSSIYLNPEEFGIDKDVVKTLAYAYITRELRKDIIKPRVANVENNAIELLPQIMTPEQIKQAKALYIKLMAQMNKERSNPDRAILKDD